jgi:hypothetical protein
VRAIVATAFLSAFLLSAAPARAAESPTELPLDSDEIALPAGFSRVSVAVTPGAMASIAVFGERFALHHFAVREGVRAGDPLAEDGFLPRVVSFVVPDGITQVELTVEVASDVILTRTQLSPTRALPTEDAPGTLVGLPWPRTRDDGYLCERPGRYQMGRPDVLLSLLEAFRETRARYRRDPIGVSDLSQWDGRRPALDLGNPRHVSHEGGRDVDIGLPSTEEPSLMRDHCEKVIAPDYQKAVCKPGTGRALDTYRLAFLLGRLVKTGTVDKIFLDDEFIEPVARAASTLAAQHVIPTRSAEAMQPGAGMLKHLPWHTDHVHVRFLGAKAAGPWPGRVASPPPGE